MRETCRIASFSDVDSITLGQALAAIIAIAFAFDCLLFPCAPLTLPLTVQQYRHFGLLHGAVGHAVFHQQCARILRRQVRGQDAHWFMQWINRTGWFWRFHGRLGVLWRWPCYNVWDRCFLLLYFLMIWKMWFFLFREEYYDTEKPTIKEEGCFVYEFQWEVVESGLYEFRGLQMKINTGKPKSSFKGLKMKKIGSGHLYNCLPGILARTGWKLLMSSTRKINVTGGCYASENYQASLDHRNVLNVLTSV